MLYNYELPGGDFVKYKGRLYCWAGITSNGKIKFTDKMLQVLNIQAGTELLVIRSSNIALGLAAKGLLLEKIKNYRDRIKTH